MAELDKATLTQLRDLVNGTGRLGAVAVLGFLDSKIPSAAVTQLPGSRMVEEYVDGSGIAETPFDVRYRVKPDDSDSRATVFGEMSALADDLESLSSSGQLPAGWISLRGVDTPTIVERADNGSEVWRCSFLLESKRSAPSA